MEVIQFLGSYTAGLAVVIGLVKAFRGLVPERFVPLSSVAVGVVVMGGFTLATGGAISGGILNGIILGLAASGLYDNKALFSKGE